MLGEPLRIGIVCPYAWDVPGGVQFHIRDLTKALTQAGHHVGVLAPADSNKGLPDYVTSTGKPIAVSWNGSVARLGLRRGTVDIIKDWLRTGDYDVMHVHEPMAPGVSWVAMYAAQGPIVATWHSSSERSRVLAMTEEMGQTIMEKLRGRIAVSELARRTLVDHLGGDAILIPNGVDCASFTKAEPFDGWPGPGKSLFFLGRSDEPRKGLPVLLGALPEIIDRHPDLRVLLAGPGDEKAVRKGLPKDLAGRLTFQGLVSEEDKVRSFHSATAYVAPNTGGESFGIVLLEAMASRTPVIASDLEAFTRVLDDGRAGALFRNEDPADLARVANELLDDPVRRKELAERGEKRAWLYDWSRVTGEIVDVYRSVAIPGEKVTEDFSGMWMGRILRRGGTKSRRRG